MKLAGCSVVSFCSKRVSDCEAINCRPSCFRVYLSQTDSCWVYFVEKKIQKEKDRHRACDRLSLCRSC